MANDLNQCTFTGRLGRDVEQRFLPNGDAVANFSIAVGWKSKDKEGAEWVNVVAFGKLAEICTQYLAKGSKVLVGGAMRTRKWKDQNGNDKYTTEIVADKMLMLDGKQERSAPKGANAASLEAQAPRSAPVGPAGMDFDTDIPFTRVMNCHAI